MCSALRSASQTKCRTKFFMWHSLAKMSLGVSTIDRAKVWGGEEGRKRKRGRERETEIERKTERQRHKRSHRQKNRDRERQRELGLTDLLFANSSVNEISLLVLAGKREKADKSQFKLKKLTMK